MANKYDIEAETTTFALSGVDFTDAMRIVNVVAAPTAETLYLTIENCTFLGTWQALVVGNRPIVLVFRGNTITFPGTAGSNFQGIYMPYQCESATIEDNTIINAYQYGILIGEEPEVTYGATSTRTGVVISGNTITGTWGIQNGTNKDGYAICERSTSPLIEDNEITDVTLVGGFDGEVEIERQLCGLYLAGINGTARSNILTNAGQKALMVKDSGWVIDGNTITNTNAWLTTGTYAYGSHGITISDGDCVVKNNTVSGFCRPIYHQTHEPNVLYYRNTVTPNADCCTGTMTAIGFWAQYMGSRTRWLQNTIVGGRQGFYLQMQAATADIEDILIKDNTVSDCTVNGIYLYFNDLTEYTWDGIDIVKNTFTSMPRGIYASYAAGTFSNVLITANDFTDCVTETTNTLPGGSGSSTTIIDAGFHDFYRMLFGWRSRSPVTIYVEPWQVTHAPGFEQITNAPALTTITRVSA